MLESFDNATYTTQTLPFAFHGSNYDDFTYGASADFEWGWTSTSGKSTMCSPSRRRIRT